MANNTGTLLGGIQIVVGAILAFTPLAPIGWSLIISGALTIAASLIAPRPSGGSGIEQSTTYGSNIRSVAAEGAPKKILLGAMRMRPEIVSMKTVNTGDSETVFLLCHVGTGGDYGIESITDIEINNTPADHFKGTQIQTRLGTATQTVMTGYDASSIAYPVAEEIPESGYSYETVGEVDEVTIVLAWYAGLASISKSGIGATTWTAQVQYKNDGSTKWHNVNAPKDVEDGWGTYEGGGLGLVATGATTSVARRTIVLEFPTRAKRTIQINPYKSWSDSSQRRQATVVRIEEGTDDGNAYPGEALLGLKYITSGQLAGGLPKVTCLVKGWKVKNLGDSSAAWTQNPAKLLYAVMTDEKNGTGRYTPASMFDDGAGGTWRDARDYFDEQVIVHTEHGRTKLEDRAHLDLIIDTMQTASEWIEHIEKLTRAVVLDWGEDGIRLVVDAAGSSVATFDGRQARDSANRPILQKEDGTVDLIEHETPTDQRTTHIKAIYWDEDDGYARRFTDEIVDPDYIAGDPRVTVELMEPGVTRQSQALRDCRYRLNVDRLRTVAYDFGVGIGDLDLLPMDIITLRTDSPSINEQAIVVSTSYSGLSTGRVACVLYDAAVYSDTSDTLQKKSPSLSHAKALKVASAIPVGVSNVHLTEVPGSSHLRADWDVQPDANRRILRVYLSRTAGAKGSLQAELDPVAQSYLIRNVGEGSVWVSILSVSRAGTEEDFGTSAAVGRMLVTRQKTKPSAVTNAAVAIIGGPSKAVRFDPPDADDPPQKLEIIKGPDEHRGQIVGTVEAERTGTTSDQGQSTQSVPLPSLPGRRTGGGVESVVVRAVNAGGKASGAATALTVPYLDMPNHTPTLLSSIVGTTLVGYQAAGNTDAWEYDATDGVRLKAIPNSDQITDANGWGTSGSGLYADNPSGARYLVAGTITSDEIDLGAVRTFVLECYDEAQRDAADVFADIESRRLNDFVTSPVDWIPPESQVDEAVDGSPIWAYRLLQSNGKAMRPLDTTLWEYRIKDTSPVDGDWLRATTGALLRGRYIETRFTLSDPLGMHQVSSAVVYARAWVPVGDVSVVTVSGAYTVADLETMVVVTATATVTLPDPADVVGRSLEIKSGDLAAVVTVETADGLIDGDSSQLVGGRECISVRSDGTDWQSK